MNELDYIGANELVYNTDNENGVYSGGFSVNSVLMKAGMSPIMTLNTQTGGTNKVSDLFESLVIPNWALSYNDKMIGGEYKEKLEKEESDDEIDDDLHDKLLGLVREHESKLTSQTNKKRKTRKPRTDSKKGGTRKRKMK
jgi:hypothetical protein